MKHIMAAVAAVLLLACASPSVRTPESVVQITWFEKDENGQVSTYTCTGFVVNMASVLTAEHCLPPLDVTTDVFVDGKATRVLKRNESLALLAIDPGKVPLTLAKKMPVVGDQLWSWGHAYSGPLIVIGRHVAGLIDDHLIVDGPIARGMSGGPIVNELGHVVGINQATQEAVGIACPVEEIREFIR